MADLPQHARVVIIGGGAVGASALYHLALAGWTDCVLLEKNELTSGSTWHAAGNVPTFSSSWSIMNMQRYSAELYRDLAERVDYPMNYHVTGSIRLAHTRERMQEFERVKGMGRYQGMELEVCGPSELRERYPFLELHDLKGGLWDPYDGDIDPAQLTQALAKGARDLGARVIRFCPVTAARREGGEWVLTTPQGEIRCEYVVNAAGYRAQEVGAMFGRTVPMATMSHQYILFEEVEEVAALAAERGRKLPLLRDVDVSYYLRQEKNGFNLGPYERECRAHWATPDDPMPEDFSFQLWPDDLERLEPYLEDALARVPVMGKAGLSKVINGPIPYTPDGNPLIGPMPGVPNAFEACVFTFGICQAGGAGKVLAEWVTQGGTEWDMWSCDPRRFGPWIDHQYCVDKAREVYGHEYAIHFPHHAWPAARDRRLSPIHDRIRRLGGQMGAFNGWERALWFAQPGDDTSEEATQTWDRAGPWEPRVREECEAVRDAAGILDLPGFSRFNLEGAGAAEWLASRITGVVPRVGRIGLVYFADERGRIVTEMSVVRHREDLMTLITAAAAEGHDFDILARGLEGVEGITLTNRTEEYSTQILSGPASRAILAAVCKADLSQPWLTHQATEIAGRWARLIRVSFAGELGWEIHTKVADTAEVFDAVWEAGQSHGLRPFGMFALNSLRIEKGYRAWKGDLSTDYTMLQGGLDRFVKFDKPHDFPGKAALMAEQQRGVTKRFVALIVEAGASDAPYMSTLWHEGQVVGETTSGAWGYRVGASVALGMLRADLAVPGTRVEVEIFGQRRPAMVQPDAPLWDPANARLKA
ncbi:FAD-dependent oxidoreductase [Limibaculum sp. FT325]|uniref:GcvT family protein n=1 Tax=Thermohalobaculum sediminis TaxID=2939436 RepID=UPI0020BE6F18|nr:FAD-dependent oxidoreductase [Limibaculum sediminis]MCL5778163.1 FAD-dependent oxidoreductase [Limibaculum sediminis]